LVVGLAADGGDDGTGRVRHIYFEPSHWILRHDQLLSRPQSDGPHFLGNTLTAR